MHTYKLQIPRVRLVREKSVFEQAQITTSRDAANYIRQFYDDDIDIYESFYVVFLNQSHKTIGWAKLSQGGITATVVDIRLLAKMALDCLACRVILAHNHPSGQLQPSEADRQITQRVKDTLMIFDVRILDHVILAPESGYYSFADEGLL